MAVDEIQMVLYKAESEWVINHMSNVFKHIFFVFQRRTYMYAIIY